MPDTISIGTACPATSGSMALGVTLFASMPNAPVMSVPEDQLYYWSRHWQDEESRAVAEIRDGETVEFQNGTDAIRWLLSED